MVVVFLFFLGLRNALFVGIAIPLSMLMGILWIWLSGVTLNIVVLFALILALGLLVDNGIVIVENVYRYLQKGRDSDDAAKFGAGEVAWPIIASTATTLAAFSPLAVWPGIVGEFMKYFPITLILVLTSSLIVALVINPVLASYFMRLDERSDESSKSERPAGTDHFDNRRGHDGGRRVRFTHSVKRGCSTSCLIATVITLVLFLCPAATRVFLSGELPAVAGTEVRPVYLLCVERWSKTIVFGTVGLLFLSIFLTVRQPAPDRILPERRPDLHQRFRGNAARYRHQPRPIAPSSNMEEQVTASHPTVPRTSWRPS